MFLFYKPAAPEEKNGIAPGLLLRQRRPTPSNAGGAPMVSRSIVSSRPMPAVGRDRCPALRR